MSVQLLDKTRKINKLLHNSSSSKVVFNDICQVLMETLSSNILVLSKKGKVLGVSICRVWMRSQSWSMTRSADISTRYWMRDFLVFFPQRRMSISRHLALSMYPEIIRESWIRSILQVRDWERYSCTAMIILWYWGYYRQRVWYNSCWPGNDACGSWRERRRRQKTADR